MFSRADFRSNKISFQRFFRTQIRAPCSKCENKKLKRSEANKTISRKTRNKNIEKFRKKKFANFAFFAIFRIFSTIFRILKKFWQHFALRTNKKFFSLRIFLRKKKRFVFSRNQATSILNLRFSRFSWRIYVISFSFICSF